ncbi:MAG: DNA polymerase I [Polyangiaceae bacterium]|nr:DNA polymerase I [Polyangiaceae bacterium]
MPSALPEAGADDVLYLVDLSGYVFRAFHAIAPTLTSPAGEPTWATLGTVTMLQRMVTERRPKRLVVAMDSATLTFRSEIDPRYKAHRPAPPPELIKQMVRCRELVEAHRMPVVQLDGFEADDIIATAVKAARAAGLRAVVVSADKDLMQLVGDDVVLWDTMRNKVYGPEEVREKFGVPPALVRDALALMGDASDNVPGVPSVGPKTAAELLLAHGSLEGVYANLDKIARKKLQEALRTNEGEARLSQRLVTLREDVPVDVSPATLVPGEPDVPKLRTLFTELNFTRLLASLEKAAAAAAKAGGAAAGTAGTAGAAGAAGTAEGATGAAGGGAAPAPEVARAYRMITSEAELSAFVNEAQGAAFVAVDTETDGLDPVRAKLLGMSLAYRPGEGVYIPLGHAYEGAPTQLTLEAARRVVGPLLGGTKPAVVGHHLKFDEMVLRRHGFRLGQPAFDTMVASYLLDPDAQHGLKEMAQRELGATMTTYEQVTEKQRGKQLAFAEVKVEAATAYAGADALLSLELCERLAPRLEAEGLLPLLRDVELPLAMTLNDMELAGILVDTAALGAMGKVLEGQMVELEAKAKKAAGREFNINAPRQLEVLLFDELKLPVIKRTKTARSTDAEVLDALTEHHPLPAIILEHRHLAKLKSTYLDALPGLVNPDTGRIHTRYSQTVAATGRLSSNDPNLQNIPVRTEAGRAIRAAFVAPPGFRLLSADYSQIELRILAHLSHDPEFVAAFKSGDDVHARTAAGIFHVERDAVTATMRRVAKTINFGVIYGMGDSALGKRLGIPREEAAAFIEAYFKRYAGVRAYLDRSLDEARSAGGVTTLLGRRRFLPDLSSGNRAARLQAERIAQNTPIQGTAADILKAAMIRLRPPVVPGSRMLLTVHDELIFEVPEALVEQAGKLIQEAMAGVAKLDVPLVVDVGSGKTWAEAHG